MIRSGTIPENLNSDVVVANDPMPSVSKKLVTAPTPSESGVGAPRSVAGDGAVPRVPRSAIMVFVQPATNTTVSAASAASNPVIGFISPVAYNRSRHAGPERPDLLFPLVPGIEEGAHLRDEVVRHARLWDET